MDESWLLHNASEYTINGKTYRNLEAQVLYNKKLSEQNAEDIDALEGRMDTAEENISTLEQDVDALESRMDIVEGDIAALGSTIVVVDVNTATYAGIDALLSQGYTPLLRSGSTYFTFFTHSSTKVSFVQTEGNTNVLWEFNSDGTSERTETSLVDMPFFEAVEQDIRDDIAALGKGVFLVTVTGDTTDPTRPASADKTWAEIWAAITSGKEVFCVFNLAYFRYMALGADATFPLIFANSGAYTDTGRMDTIQVNSNDVWQRVTVALIPVASDTIATGDKLIVGRTESNGDIVAKGTIGFDSTVTDEYLCRDGTWKQISGGGGVPLAANSVSVLSTPLPEVTITTEVNP